MFSFVGDTVLDPFLGSGTTMLAAAKMAVIRLVLRSTMIMPSKQKLEWKKHLGCSTKTLLPCTRHEYRMSKLLPPNFDSPVAMPSYICAVDVLVLRLSPKKVVGVLLSVERILMVFQN